MPKSHFDLFNFWNCYLARRRYMVKINFLFNIKEKYENHLGLHTGKEDRVIKIMGTGC